MWFMVMSLIKEKKKKIISYKCNVALDADFVLCNPANLLQMPNKPHNTPKGKGVSPQKMI